MKKILIISYFFPPCNLVGAQRPYSWYKHFHKFGLYPVVITRHWNHEVKTMSDANFPDNTPPKIECHDWGEVHFLPYKGTFRDRFLARHGKKFGPVRRLITLWELFFQYISFSQNPYKFIHTYIESLAKTDHWSAIVVSANPFPLFAVGNRLSKKYNIPWVADYRDDWTTNGLTQKSWIDRYFLLPLEQACEKRWLSSCRFFSSVTAEYVHKIGALINKKGILVLNGYENLCVSPPSIFDGELKLLYAGTVYGIQDFSILADGALLYHKKTKQPVKIVFAGALLGNQAPPPIEKMRRVLAGSAVTLEVLSRMEAARFNELMKTSNALLMVPYGAEKGIISAKIFHYLSCGKPILLAGKEGGIIESTLAPYSLAYISHNTQQVCMALEEITERYINQNTKPTHEDLEYLSHFSRESQSSIFAENINKYLVDNSIENQRSILL